VRSHTCAAELFTRFLPRPSTVSRVKLGLATLAAFVAAVAALPAHASTPMPWCGTSSSSVDRAPDATSAYAVHVAYVRPPDAPDRFSQFAPRIVGDVAAFDAWWRSQDSARTPRFDLFPAPGCASAFGALDISNVQLPRPAGGIGAAFQEIRLQLADIGFDEPEKAYLVYFDGPTGQFGDEHVCGQGARAGFGLPGTAVVYLDSCEASEGDSLRPVVAIHELVHVFGAVERSAPNSCQSGHVCDFGLDLMTAVLTGEELETHVLDSGRNDYYGHSGTWSDVQDSTFLERLDSPDRIPPTLPDGLRVGDDRIGFVRFSWRDSTDDVGPVAYRIYQDARFIRQVTTTSVLLPDSDEVALYSVRAADAVGRLSPPVGARFDPDVGMVDAQGRLLRDTVRPPAIGRVTIKRTPKVAVLSWPAAHDAGGLRAYRVRIGTRSLTVRKPTITITRAKVGGPVSIAAIDRAGNIGPSLVVARARVR
jgi:hypothetical protein